MKKIFLTVFAFHLAIGVSLFAISNVSVNDSSCKEKKIYIRTDKILIDQNKMFFINDEEFMIPLRNLFQDAEGIYISDNKTSSSLRLKKSFKRGSLPIASKNIRFSKFLKRLS